MKKLISMMLAAALVVSCAACGGGGTTSSSAGGGSTSGGTSSGTIALEDEKPELKILSMHQTYNYEDCPAWALDTEITGYKTDWYMLPAENADQKLLLEISSGEDYDLLLRISQSQYAALNKQGALIELNDLLDTYGDNIKPAISEMAWSSTTSDDGIITAMPHEDGNPTKENPYGMMRGGIAVRSDMLAEMGTELPTNLDDFTEFLRAAKEKYNFAPLSGNSSWVSQIMSAFGMGDAEWYDIDGTYTHRIKHPQLANYIEYMQMLYSEGLLDNDMPINTADQVKEKISSGNSIAATGIFFWDIPSMITALETSNPDCKLEFITELAPDANTKPTKYVNLGVGTFTCISKNAKHAADAVNWLNILSDPENFERVYIGEEGVSFNLVDGNYTPIFEGDDATNFNAYTNNDKQTGFCEVGLMFKMWQSRARKTPEMAESYETMNARCDDYEVVMSIENFAKTLPAVQEDYSVVTTAFGDSIVKAIVEGTDPATAVAAMQADWDANGGLEIEAAMQEFYDSHKALIG